MDLNNRRTGKDATKPRSMGLLGHSVKGHTIITNYDLYYFPNYERYNEKDKKDALLLIFGIRSLHRAKRSKTINYIGRFCTGLKLSK